MKDKLELLAQEILTFVKELGLLCFRKVMDADSAPIVVHWPGKTGSGSRIRNIAWSFIV